MYKIPVKYQFPFILILYVTAYILLYPSYQYIFDLDGIGYLSITKRLAAGDFVHGINGFWPPLHSWLAIPFYKAGLNEFAAFRVLNGLIGAGILIVVNRLLIKANIDRTLRITALLVCIPVILSYAFAQLAADILLCLLLLVYTDIITEKDFFQNPAKNCTAGFMGCLCYFAKTYAFPFFILHFLILQWVLYKRSVLPARKKLMANNLLLGFSSFIILIVPWVLVLYSRYHIVTLGHVFVFGESGQINLSYYFHPNTDISYPLIVSPPEGLCCGWENPLLQLTQQPQYYSSMFSMSFVAHEIRVILFNVVVALKLVHAISFLGPAITLALGLFVWQKKDLFLTLLLFIIILFPSGYLLLHVEDRFLWPLTFLLLIAGSTLAVAAFRFIPVKRPARLFFWCLFFGSFIISPVDTLKDTRGKDAGIFQLAGELNTLHVKGKFMSVNAVDVARLAYLTGSYFYQPTDQLYSYRDLLLASRQLGIDYFFYYYNTSQELEAFKQTAFYKGAAQEISTKIPNLLLLKMK